MYRTMESVFRERNHSIAVRPCFTTPAATVVAVRQSSATISLRVSLFLFEISFAAARISLSLDALDDLNANTRAKTPISLIAQDRCRRVPPQMPKCGQHGPNAGASPLDTGTTLNSRGAKFLKGGGLLHSRG